LFLNERPLMVAVDPTALLPHSDNLARRGDIGRRIALDEQKVSAEPPGDAPAIRKLEGLGGFGPRGGECLGRCQPNGDEQREPAVDACTVRRARVSAIRTREDRYPRRR
jgi:hypothetical protein